MGQQTQIPLPEVADSDFGAFTAAVQAQQRQASPADRLIAYAKVRSTSDGYTSWPAYAERLERIVISLMTPDSGAAA